MTEQHTHTIPCAGVAAALDALTPEGWFGRFGGQPGQLLVGVENAIYSTDGFAAARITLEDRYGKMEPWSVTFSKPALSECRKRGKKDEYCHVAVGERESAIRFEDGMVLPLAESTDAKGWVKKLHSEQGVFGKPCEVDPPEGMTGGQWTEGGGGFRASILVRMGKAAPLALDRASARRDYLKFVPANDTCFASTRWTLCPTREGDAAKTADHLRPGIAAVDYIVMPAIMDGKG